MSKIERDYKRIHKKIRKFYEKYKDKRNICLNLQCNKENDSYDICLYVNPQFQEYKIMQENLKLDMLWFNQRKELEQKYKEWTTESNVADSGFNLITFLEINNLLDRIQVKKFLNRNRKVGK